MCKFTDGDKLRIALESELFLLSKEYGGNEYQVAYNTSDGVNAQTS